MLPKEYLTRLSAAVVKRSGICQATVEQVLPALFDEIRYQLIEGRYHCVPIESFGTFGIVEIPERQYHYTYLFITHDLSVVHYMADRIMVMQKGKIVESGTPDDIFHNPQTAYTRTLIDAIPRIS